MSFIFEKIPQLNFDLQDETTENGRVYITPDGNRYPSITTILSATSSKEGLIAWRERVGEEEANKIVGRSSRRGTELHSICEKYLLNEMSPLKLKMMMPHVKELFYKMKPFIDSSVNKVHALEQPLYSNQYKMAGRTDCICEWDGKTTILDFKNSRKIKKKEYIENYFVQCTAYSLMFEEITKQPIDNIVVLIGVEEGPGQVFVESTSSYKDILMQRLELYYDQSNSLKLS
jgi:hypothetical protein